MTEDGDNPVWFGEDSDTVTTDLDPDAGTDQTWFNGLEFKPTPRGRPPDIDRDFDTARIEPTTDRDVDDIDISVTSSLQNGPEATSQDATEKSAATDTADAPASPDATTPDAASANGATEPERDGASGPASEHASSERGAVDVPDGTATGGPEPGAEQDQHDEHEPADEGPAGATETGSEGNVDDGESGLLAWLRSLFS